MWIRFIVFFVVVWGATPVDGVLAVVEKEVILKSDVLQQSYALASQRNIDPYNSPLLFESLYEDVLNQMVDNLVLYDLASKDTTITILDQDVEASLGVELQKRIEIAGSVSALEEMLGESFSLIQGSEYAHAYLSRIRNALRLRAANIFFLYYYCDCYP